MSQDKDVTKQVDFGNPDDEFLPLTKCICRKEYEMWENSISIYRDSADKCDSCGRKSRL